MRAAVDAIIERWGEIDVLINNAGVIQVGPLEHMTPADFENAMATHFWGPLHLMFAIVPAMRQRGFGRIVNISSIGGQDRACRIWRRTARASSRSPGSRTRSAPNSHQYGIRVTTVAPGLMRTGSPPTRI